MKKTALFLTISSIVLTTTAAVTEEEELKYTFNAAVVEYLPSEENSNLSDSEKLKYAVDEYLQIIQDVATDDKTLDLIVFPESTLTFKLSKSIAATVVPDPFTEIPCKSSDTLIKDHLKQFSCAAIEFNTTIVLNLIEAAENGDGFVYYNTNVGFNEEGYVSARYRKYNLFGEIGLEPADKPEPVTITTRNNDSFGTFTCFDILFLTPTLNLTRDLAVTNVIFTSMWFSELPYLTALQTQQMWAIENDVNFLSAGANSPARGSGGTAIFVGNRGALESVMVGGDGGTRVIKKRVPRLDVEGNPFLDVIPAPREDDGVIDGLALEKDGFKLKQDSSIKDHTSVVLNISNDVTVREVCDGDDVQLCCNFNVSIAVDETITSPSKNQYVYHLAVFSGIRSYDGVRDGAVESCALMACLNESVTSCGLRFSDYSSIIWPVTFQTISVSGKFSSDENRIQFPNSLLSSIKPIPSQYKSWTRELADGYSSRTHSLHEPQNRLMTFGIYGRDFNRDPPTKNNNSAAVAVYDINFKLLLTLFTVMMSTRL